MVLERTQRRLWEEIEAAQERLAPHTETLDLEELAACGRDYGRNRTDKTIPDDPENHRHSFIRQFLAEVAQGTPQAILEGHGDAWPPDRVALIEAALNQVAAQPAMREFMRRTAVDFCFRRAQAVCTLNEREGGGPLYPTAKRLSFRDYLRDSTSVDRESAMWEGHRVAKPIDVVIAEAKRNKSLGWNLDALERVKDGLTRDVEAQKRRPSKAERHELVYWPMWERGGGDNGTVHYVLDQSIPHSFAESGDLIRESEPWGGHWDGPYAVSGALPIVEGDVELSPLIASSAQANMVNDIARAVLEAVANYKAITASLDENVSAWIRNAVSGDVVTVTPGVMQDIRAMIARVETGGVSDQLLVAFQHSMESLQRNSGSYQNRQGQVQKDATATAIIDAARGFASTMGLYADGHRDFLRQVYARWAYWIDANKNVSLSVGPLPPEISEMLSRRTGRSVGPFVDIGGGLNDKGTWSIRDHAALGIRIDPYSTRARDEASSMQNMQLLLAMIQSLQAMGPAVLSVDVDALMREFARAHGMKAAERIVDSRRLYGLALMALGQQGEAGKPQPTAQRGAQLTFDTPSTKLPGGGRPVALPQASPQPKDPQRKTPAVQGAAA